MSGKKNVREFPRDVLLPVCSGILWKGRGLQKRSSRLLLFLLSSLCTKLQSHSLSFVFPSWRVPPPLRCALFHIPNYSMTGYFISTEYSTLLNIVFLVANAESVDRFQKGNFAKEKAFVTGLVKTFNVTRNDTSAGVIVYSNSASIVYRLADKQGQTELESVTDSLHLSGSGHHIGKAMDLAWKDFFNVSSPEGVKVRNVLVVITDDSSDDDVALPSYILRNNNVSIFSVGVDRYKRGQLKEMATDPNSWHVHTIDDYPDFGPLIGPVKDAILRGTFHVAAAPSVPRYKKICPPKCVEYQCRISV